MEDKWASKPPVHAKEGLAQIEGFVTRDEGKNRLI